jgi:hypothetical protein
MAKIRKGEDERERTRVRSMLDAKVIKKSDTVNELSLVVVSQTLVDLANNSKTTILAEYMAVDLSAPSSEKFRTLLVGRKSGETVEEKVADDKLLLISVAEIYNLVEREAIGESNSTNTEGGKGEVQQKD